MELSIRPYPAAECLPPGVTVWFWAVHDVLDTHVGRERIASGSVQCVDAFFTTHAAQVIPACQRQGIYSGVVLPGLANHFGTIHSDLNLSIGSHTAWRRAGGIWLATRFRLVGNRC